MAGKHCLEMIRFLQTQSFIRMPLIYEAKFTERVSEILSYLESNIGNTPEKKLSKQRFSHG